MMYMRAAVCIEYPSSSVAILDQNGRELSSSKKSIFSRTDYISTAQPTEKAHSYNLICFHTRATPIQFHLKLNFNITQFVPGANI